MVWSDESDREWLTEEECARRLGCSLTRVRELVERNVLRARYNCYGGIEVECAVVTGRMRACPPSETIGPRVDERGAAEASAASAENRCGPRPQPTLAVSSASARQDGTRAVVALAHGPRPHGYDSAQTQVRTSAGQLPK